MIIGISISDREDSILSVPSFEKLLLVILEKVDHLYFNRLTALVAERAFGNEGAKHFGCFIIGGWEECKGRIVEERHLLIGEAWSGLFFSKVQEYKDAIVEELLAAQGSPVDLGGYYLTDAEIATRVMRASATFNAIIDAM